MIPSGLQNYSPEHIAIKDITIDSLMLEAWKLDIKHLNNLREPMLILLSKCKTENETGGCIEEQYLTLVDFDNACCDLISNDYVSEAEWFYVLDSYPFIKERHDIIFQAFATNSKTNLLKYPVENPFQ